MLRKSSIPSNSSRSKKSANKEKERKKNIALGEPCCSNSSSNSCNMEKIQSAAITENVELHTGFGSETIQCISEQFNNEVVSEDICYYLAEDISSKIRDVIQIASINMVHGKRKVLKEDDINATFKKINVEGIYGPAEPNWATFDDPNNLSYIPDESINLYELATSELSITQPGDIGINYKWLNDTSLFNQVLVSNSLNNYSNKIMNAAVSHKKALRMLALKDVSKNVNIGPIIPHLCNFCFLILQKNITYSSLAAPTLQFLEAIMFNPCTSYSVEENQINLLIYLLLGNILNATNSQLHDVVPICRTLGRLCMNWIRGNQFVIEKIDKYILPEEPVKRLTAPVICALTYIGNEALDILLWPNIKAMFRCLLNMDTMESAQIKAAILSAASLFYTHDNLDQNINNFLREEFADRLLPIWRWKNVKIEQNTDETALMETRLTESNWINIKIAYFKTLKIHSQQQILHRTSQFQTLFRKAKPAINTNRKIHIMVTNSKSLPLRTKSKSTSIYYVRDNQIKETVNIITGRRTLCTFKKSFSINKVICKKNVRDMMIMI